MAHVLTVSKVLICAKLKFSFLKKMLHFVTKTATNFSSVPTLANNGSWYFDPYTGEVIWVNAYFPSPSPFLIADTFNFDLPLNAKNFANFQIQIECTYSNMYPMPFLWESLKTISGGTDNAVDIYNVPSDFLSAFFDETQIFEHLQDLTAEKLNNPDFGISLQCNPNGTWFFGTAYVQSVTISFTYETEEASSAFFAFNI